MAETEREWYPLKVNEWRKEATERLVAQVEEALESPIDDPRVDDRRSLEGAEALQ